MKAMLCKAFGEPESLVLEEIASRPLAGNEIRVRVHVAGVRCGGGGRGLHPL